MSTTDEKQNIISLPIHQRAVAVALKHIFDKIKQLQDQENEQVQKIHHSFITKFKEVQHNASQVIQGAPIAQKYLQNTDKFFTEEQRKSVTNLAQKNKGVQAYWLTTLIAFYEDRLTLSDKEIATAIVDVSTNVTKDSFEITFQIGTNEWLAATTLTKRFVLEEGAPTKVQGDNAKWLKANPQGIFSILFSQLKTPQQIEGSFSLTCEFINEIIPYSLEYFLGANEGGSEIDEEEEEQEQSQEEDEQPSKKVKE